MARPLVDDELWSVVEPLLPPAKPRRHRYPRRKPVDPRKALTGILFVLKTGIQWEDLPAEMGVAGTTCWRKLDEWQRAGVWDRLLEVLQAKLRKADRFDWERAAVDSSYVRALHGGSGTGPSPVDRAKAGSKHHVLTDGRGTPLVVKATKANRADIAELDSLVEALPRVRGRRGRPRRRPKALLGDRGYDSEPHRQRLRAQGIQPRLAKRGVPHGSGLGRYRWVVERTHAWLHQFRRLRTRYEKRIDLHRAFLTLGACLICWNTLTGSG